MDVPNLQATGDPQDCQSEDQDQDAKASGDQQLQPAGAVGDDTAEKREEEVGKTKSEDARPNCEEELVMSNTSQPRIKNCIPWAMAWLAPFSQNQRKLL